MKHINHGPKPAAPDHLAVYLSNRCNLGCPYCFVSVNQGPPEVLDYERLRASVDFFLSSKVDSPDKKITFLGGEPFLNFPLLERVVRYAREQAGDGVVLQTFTNGTLLTRERLEFLTAFDVHTTISLDGDKATNDAQRPFYNEPDRSVFDAVMSRLEGLPKDVLGVSLVFTSKTVEKLLSNVDHFYRMGFGRITFNPELYELWPEDRVAVLKKVMAGFTRYYRRILEGGMRPFVVPILFSVLGNREAVESGVLWWRQCHNVVLGPDGQFYGCDKALSFPMGEAKSQQVGNAREGMDWERRDAHFAEAADYINQRGLGTDEYFCPMGVYFHSRISGTDPEIRLRNFHAVSAAFTDGLTDLIRRLEGHPTFQELYFHANVV